MRKKRKVDPNVLTGRKVVQQLISEVKDLQLGPKNIVEFCQLVKQQAAVQVGLPFKIMVEAQEILKNTGRLCGEIGRATSFLSIIQPELQRLKLIVWCAHPWKVGYRRGSAISDEGTQRDCVLLAHKIGKWICALLEDKGLFRGEYILQDFATSVPNDGSYLDDRQFPQALMESNLFRSQYFCDPAAINFEMTTYQSMSIWQSRSTSDVMPCFCCLLTCATGCRLDVAGAPRVY